MAGSRPVVTRDDAVGGEQQAGLADSVSLALLVVFQALEPAERLAFILQDMFAVPFDEIAPVVGKSPAATRPLASRARRAVQGAQARPDADLNAQRHVVDAFFAAARQGQFDDLVAVLDPDVVLRSDGGTEISLASAVVRGAEGVAARAITFSRPGATLLPVLVNWGGRRGGDRQRQAVCGDGVHGQGWSGDRDRRDRRPAATRQPRHAGDPRPLSQTGATPADLFRTGERSWRRVPGEIECCRRSSTRSASPSLHSRPQRRESDGR